VLAVFIASRIDRAVSAFATGPGSPPRSQPTAAHSTMANPVDTNLLR
jgi:hypothetical protein